MYYKAYEVIDKNDVQKWKMVFDHEKLPDHILSTGYRIARIWLSTQAKNKDKPSTSHHYVYIEFHSNFMIESFCVRLVQHTSFGYLLQTILPIELQQLFDIRYQYFLNNLDYFKDCPYFSIHGIYQNTDAIHILGYVHKESNYPQHQLLVDSISVNKHANIDPYLKGARAAELETRKIINKLATLNGHTYQFDYKYNFDKMYKEKKFYFVKERGEWKKTNASNKKVKQLLESSLGVRYKAPSGVEKGKLYHSYFENNNNTFIVNWVVDTNDMCALFRRDFYEIGNYGLNRHLCAANYKYSETSVQYIPQGQSEAISVLYINAPSEVKNSIKIPSPDAYYPLQTLHQHVLLLESGELNVYPSDQISMDVEKHRDNYGSIYYVSLRHKVMKTTLDLVVSINDNKITYLSEYDPRVNDLLKRRAVLERLKG